MGRQTGFTHPSACTIGRNSASAVNSTAGRRRGGIELRGHACPLYLTAMSCSLLYEIDGKCDQTSYLSWMLRKIKITWIPGLAYENVSSRKYSSIFTSA